MKGSILVIATLCFVCACSEDNNTPTGPVNDAFDPAGATVIKQGTFIGVGGHTVSGTATVYSKNNEFYVVLDPFNSQNGPDLRVYLSKDINAGSFLNLGLLKSTTGKQSYKIPGNPDFNEYGYVHVWCQQFSVQFGRAEITT